MPKNSDLTESERCQIIAFHTAGFSKNNISKTPGFSKTTITRTIQNNRDGKSTKTALRSGRPGCLDHKAQQEGKMDRLAYIQIREKHLLPLISTKFNEKGYLFQQDNAPVHGELSICGQN